MGQTFYGNISERPAFSGQMTGREVARTGRVVEAGVRTGRFCQLDGSQVTPGDGVGVKLALLMTLATLAGPVLATQDHEKLANGYGVGDALTYMRDGEMWVETESELSPTDELQPRVRVALVEGETDDLKQIGRVVAGHYTEDEVALAGAGSLPLAGFVLLKPTVANATTYTFTLSTTHYDPDLGALNTSRVITYTSDANATDAEIINGLIASIQTFPEAVFVKATMAFYDGTSKALRLELTQGSGSVTVTAGTFAGKVSNSLALPPGALKVLAPSIPNPDETGSFLTLLSIDLA